MYEIDKETYELLVQLCDVALKAGGIQNKAPVDYMLGKFKAEKGVDDVGPKDK